MQGTPRFGFPAGNPLANALVAIVGIVVVAASLVVGIVALVTIGTVVLAAVLVLWIRIWWSRRGYRAVAGAGSDARGRGNSEDVIEGEYKVVERPQDKS